jgi:hypothetical protein
MEGVVCFTGGRYVRLYAGTNESGQMLRTRRITEVVETGEKMK